MAAFSAVCLRCFQYGHRREDCKNHPIVSCSACFGMNYLTRNCCQIKWRPKDEYYQSFRMVGEKNTLFFTDIPIVNKMVAGLIDTNRSTTVIDWSVFSKLHEEHPNFIYIPPNKCAFDIQNYSIARVNCKAALLKGDLRIILAMDFLAQRHMELKLDGHKLVPTLNGKPSRCSEARFQIVVHIASQEFTGIIDTSLTQTQMNYEVFRFFRNTSQYNFESGRNVCIVPLTWKNKKLELIISVEVTNQSSLVFGTDFLKGRNAEFILDGIALNINNPWKTNHQDSIQFAYNHNCGKKLRTALLADKRRLCKDARRPILQRPLLDDQTPRKEKID